MPIVTFDIGAVVTNAEIVSTFKVGNMGGMRKSNAYNCLVLISDQTKGLYEDRWYGDVLHYTGMGKNGDQVLRGNQNPTLYNSRSNGIELHLFEVLEPKKYTYCGVVSLADEPYQDEQLDESGNVRKVWMFPIKPISGAPTISADVFYVTQNNKRIPAERMNLKDLEGVAKRRSTIKPGTRTIDSTVFVRDPYVSEYTKRMAKGKCELCQQPAPFKDGNGKPYLETHHVVWLSKGGSDSIDNTVALCPNCHRKMHVINDSADITRLRLIARNRAT